MNERFRVLGQAAPAANIDTTLFTVPTGREVIVSVCAISNRGSVAGRCRVLVRVGGAAIGVHQWYVPDSELAANAVVELMRGVTLAAGDVVTVRASTADFSFSLFGSEVTV